MIPPDQAGTEVPDRSAASTGSGGAAVVDRILRVIGGALSLIGGFLAGLLSILLAPLRVGDVAQMLAEVRGGEAPILSEFDATPIPVSVLLAPLLMLVLTWYARLSTGVRWGVLLPAAGWFGMVLLVLVGTAEGDQLVLADSWVAVLTLFGGTLVLVGAVLVGLTDTRLPGGARNR